MSSNVKPKVYTSHNWLDEKDKEGKRVRVPDERGSSSPNGSVRPDLISG